MSKRDAAQRKRTGKPAPTSGKFYLPDFSDPEQRGRHNPYLTDAVGGGVGPGHGLKTDGLIECVCPETGQIQAMAYELPPGVTRADVLGARHAP